MRFVFLLIIGLSSASAMASSLPLQQLQLPAGFRIHVYAENIPNARSMDLSPSGTLFVGSRSAGKVYAIVDRNRDGKADQVYVIAQGLNMPNGVSFLNGSLYVAEVNRILRYDKIEWMLHAPPEPVVISTDFPSDEHHGWKFIRIGPDNKLYVPIGAPCNVCLEYGYAAITRLELDGSRHEIFAEGVRNTVGFDWHPVTKELWFTDNGRDQLGDDVPADELNRAPKKGMHFGFPYCHGGDTLDPEFGLGHRCKEYKPPVQKLGAHVASLGMRFYTGTMFPAEYKNQIFIAEHGSWNRSKKVGYRITLVQLKGNKAVSYTPFISGWLQGETAWGRPVDVEIMADGSMLISDDKAGVVYRLVYTGDSSGSKTQTKPALQETLDIEEKTKINPQRSNPVIQNNQPTVTIETEDSRQDMMDRNSIPVQPSSTSRQIPEQNVPPQEMLDRQNQRVIDSESGGHDPFSAVKKQQMQDSEP